MTTCHVCGGLRFDPAALARGEVVPCLYCAAAGSTPPTGMTGREFAIAMGVLVIVLGGVLALFWLWAR